MESKRERQLINCFIIIAIMGILVGIGIVEYKEQQIEKNKIAINSEYDTQNLSLEVPENEINEEDNLERKEEYPKEEIKTQYKGYQVIAKLEIPTIQLETYVLEKYSKEALNVSVTKFWGANPNEIGNFCVAGHNFQNKNMFHNLKDLEVGNQLFISDHNIGRIEYQVNQIYVVKPEDVSCLSQETNQKREVTLITCTNDSEKRIIVKAQELK